MNQLPGDLLEKEGHTDGKGLVSVTEERTQKVNGRRNGEHEDLRIMQHFITDFIERPDDIESL